MVDTMILLNTLQKGDTIDISPILHQQRIHLPNSLIG